VVDLGEGVVGHLLFTGVELFEEAVGPLHPAVVPLQLLLGRRGEEDEEPRRVGPVLLDDGVGVDGVAPG
jgi:hypothetical protein